VELRELLHQREADAAPFVGATARALDPMEALEEPRDLVRGDAGAGVAHRELGGGARLAQRDGDLARERELERVRDEIEDDLLPHPAVDIGRLRERGTIDHEPHARTLDRRAEHAGELGRERRKVDTLIRRFDAARLDAREIEQRVDELEQAQ
jgi:hypothetical protein